jgi:hypothetical protein
MGVKEQIEERRLTRMRMGQEVCEFATLVSDEEIRVALVPLLESEYEQVLIGVSRLQAEDNIAGVALRDRRQAQEILVRAIREPENLQARVYESMKEMLDDLTVQDIDHLYDEWNAMTAKLSPAADGIPPEEFENLKKALSGLNWNELSGRQWFAAKRFLFEVMPLLPLDKLLGFGLTNSSTTKNE